MDIIMPIESAYQNARQLQGRDAENAW